MTLQNKPHNPRGLLHRVAGYDFLVPMITFGRERTFRRKLLDIAGLIRGASVLDVGCGTGSLAITAKRQVGPMGTVSGVDASPEMIARAEKKANKAGLDITFREGAAQELPFPEAQFDFVFTTLMLHHLPRNARSEMAAEMKRVLKPDGKVLAVDFGLPSRERKGFLARLHRHGGTSSEQVIAVLREAGLHIVNRGLVGVADLYFVLATRATAPIGNIATNQC